MSYTNSKLVSYTKSFTKQKHQSATQIDTVSIHCVVGQCSVETLGSIFASASKEASSNYGIGYDGRIGMYVEGKRIAAGVLRLHQTITEQSPLRLRPIPTTHTE